MNTPLLPLLALLFLLAPLQAQDGKPASVNPPGPPPVVPLVPQPLARHMVLTFETYALPQEGLDALHGDGLAAKPFYERVRQFVTDGKATLENVIAIPAKSGNRATIESVDEVLYPTEFDPAKPGRPFGFPTAYEMRSTGQRVEVDPVLNEDETMADLNLAPDFTRLAGFRELKADPNAGGEIQPLFGTRKVTTALTCRLGVPTLLSTLSTPRGTGIAEADGDGKVSVTFALVRMSSPAEMMPPKTADGDGDKAGNLRMVFRFYSMPRDKARDLLESTTDADKLHELVRAMPAADWKQERIITLHTRSGQRATIEEMAENIYGTEMQPSEPPRVREKKTVPAAPTPAPGQPSPPPTPTEPPVYTSAKDLLPATFTAFEMRPTGWRIEVDPVLGADGMTVDLNLAPEHTEFRGLLEGHPLLARYPQMPVFAMQKVTTAVTATSGRQCFLGTFNAPRDTGVNGRKDDGRAWFAFVKVTVE